MIAFHDVALNSLISGALAAFLWTIALFFLRFWFRTKDRLFLIFSIAFWILGTERIVLGCFHKLNEAQPGIYLLRLFSFILIILAILDKNRSTVEETTSE